MTLIVFPQRYLMPHAALRVSGVAPFSPLDLGAKLRTWWDYTDVSNLWQSDGGAGSVSADTDPVGQVADKSGNAKHLLQATSGNKPAYRTAGYVQFDGTDDYLSIASAGFTINSFELFQVFEQHAANTTNGGLYSFAPSSGNDWQSANGLVTELGSGSLYFEFYSNTAALNIGESGSGNTPKALYETSIISGTAQAYKNGVGFGTPDASPGVNATHTGPFIDGCRYLSGAISPSSSNCGPIRRFETIMTAPLTSDERTAVRSYLMTRHGL